MMLMYSNRGSDLTFVQKVQSHHANHPNLVKKKVQAQTEFTIMHFAGEVTYDTNRFLEKNRDTVIIHFIY